MGLLLNANWILSGIATTIFAGVSIFYYGYYYNFTDVLCISFIIVLLLAVNCQTFFTERNDKSYLAQMAQIQKMNDDLKHMLMTMPEGIVLINKETQDVTLGNFEFRRLFKIPKTSNNETIGAIIKQTVLQLYNNMGSYQDPND